MSEGVRNLYGINPVTEALRGPTRVLRVLVDVKRRDLVKKFGPPCAAVGVPIDFVDKGRLFDLAGTRNHQGVVAKADPIATLPMQRALEMLPPKALVVIVDKVQDPQNLGSIYRSADGAGASLLVLPSRKVASCQLASVAKASAGAVEHVPTCVVHELSKVVDALLEMDFTVDCLEADQGVDYRDTVFPPRTAIVVGGEDSGISYKVAKRATRYVSIPMQGKVTSLNAGVAAAILFYGVQSSWHSHEL